MTWQGDYPPQIRKWRYTARQVLDGEFDTAAAEVLRRLRVNLELLGDDGCWLCRASAQHIAELQERKHE
jgi:hypothetical protein